MAQRIVKDGLILEVQPDGTGMVVGYADAPSPRGQVFTLPQSPKEAAEEARKAAADARAERSQDRADTNAEVANRLKEQEIRLAQQKEQREGNTAKDIAGWKANLANIGLLENRVKQLRTLYNEHFKGKGLQSVAESYAPKAFAPEYGVFDDTAMQMLADMAKAKGLTSQQFNTPAEQRMFFEPLIPKRGDTDEQIINKLDYLDQMIGTGRRTTEANLGIQHQQADNEVPDPTTGADLKPPPADGSPPDMPPANGGDVTATDGKNRVTYDPRMSSQIDAMINAGASKGMIDAVLKRQNFPAVTPGEWAAIQTWRKQNPGKKYYGANISRTDDLNMFQRALSNPVVAPVASGLAHYADAATAGTVGALSGEEGRGTLNAMSALHPDASVVGDVAGGVTGALGAEAAIAAKAPAWLAKFAPRAADTLYGGTYGFNTANPGEGGMGALKGAGAGLLGGFLGDRLMRGVGRGFRGVSDANVGYLADQGIPMTVGQVLGNSGWVGAGVKKAEDAMTSVPFAGNMVEARRREGLGAFANKMGDQATQPINGYGAGYGEAAVNDMLAQGSDAYANAVRGVNVPLDPAFTQELGVVRAAGDLLPPDLAGRYTKAIDNRVQPIADAGQMTGETFQQGMRGLKSYRAEATKPGFEQDYRDSLTMGMNLLRDQMNRGGGDQVVADLAKADEAWKRIKVLEKATKAARNGSRSGELGLPTPSQYNDAATAAANKFGGPRPMAELIDAGQSVLPSKVPDSGTWTRALVGGGATGVLGGGGALAGGTEGAGTGAATGLGLTLALALGGSKPAQRALVTGLVRRPDPIKRIGQKILDNAGIGGWTGAGILTPLLVGQ